MALTDTERQKIRELTEQLSQGIKELAEIQNSIAERNHPEEWEELRNAVAGTKESYSMLMEAMDRNQPAKEQEQDFSAMKRAEQYITELEAEKTIFTDEERNLIVNYAYQMDSFDDAKNLADRLSFLLENSPNLVAQTVINAREEIEQLPDSMIGLTEMHEYGYSWDEMLPLTKERATELFNNDVEIYQLHVDGAETLIEDMEDIEAHGGIFGVDKSQWGLYQEREAHAQNYFEEKNIDPVDRFLIGEQDQYGIFQLKHNEENRAIRFMSHDFMQNNGIAIDRENYDLVYTAPFTEGVTLDGLYEKFNIDRPEDFTGHSLSMSDVIVFHQNGENTSHYVDTFGFTEVPEFHRHPTIEEQIAEEETVDMFSDDITKQMNEQKEAVPQEKTLLQEENQHNISYYVIEDLATWANNSKERSILERFDNIDDAMKQFQTYRVQDWEYSDDSARTTLGISVDGIEFDMIHVRNNENYLVQDFTQMSVTKDNDQFLDVLKILYNEVGFDKTRVHREMIPEEVKDFVKERFAHQLQKGGLEDISLYMERFDTIYEQGKMENLMPTENQRRVEEDIPFTEWENPYLPMPEELAVAIEDRYISIQQVEDGYDYTIYDADYKELDGGVYDNPDISIQTALNEIVADLKGATNHTALQGNVRTDSQMIFIDYEELTGKAEQAAQQEIADRISRQVEDNRIVDHFKAKTRECFHNINGETPDDIENTVYAYVQSKIEEYDARASIAAMAVTGSRCRGLEQEKSDLDVVVEFAGNEREDNLFNMLHEDGLMIGGIKVDINPITAAQTGTLATYLPQVEQYLEEKQIERENAAKENTVPTDAPPKVSVTLTVAECSEFHNMGEYHEGIASVQEAVALWEQIPPERMHGIRGIGIQIHTEGTPEYEDIQWDVLSGKVIDLDSLSCVPDIAENLQAIRFVSELTEKIPNVRVQGTLEPLVQRQAELIAIEVDQLAHDYDTYEYNDQVEDTEANVQSIASDIRNGKAEYIEDFLNALIAEATKESIQDLFGAGLDTDNSEAVQTARQATKLLDKLTEYKPLAKVEELQEQNYNQIDNVLNNGSEKVGRDAEKHMESVSLRERLADKKAEVGKKSQPQERPEKEINKDVQRET